ncbi:MAG: hypothetical protein DSY80_02390 [Desulfocapsa sp.]|nr:MAG: hypothetical protein DSY80_02390 [Desulfocapsa sp.]
MQVTTPEGEKKALKIQLDTGASCSTLTWHDYRKLSKEKPAKSGTKLKLYDNSIIYSVGCVTLRCEAKGTRKKIHFEIVKEAPTSLLSGRASAALGLISFNEECILKVSEVSKQPELTEKQIITEYKDVFRGLGKLPGVYDIQMDTSVKPAQANPRRIAHRIKPQVKAKIDELVEMGVIAKVERPTAWISSLVIVKKPKKIRLCIDPQPLNEAIVRNHYMTPTLEDIAPRLHNAKVFSVMDAKDGFNQVVLSEESSYLTTFWTPWGRYRWLRMPFGIKSAPEEFQRRLDECLEGLENVEVIADDIIIYGSGDTQEEAIGVHDRALRALLNRCREKGLKLNEKKMRLKLQEVTYMGHRLTTEGLRPDPEKVVAVKDMERPKDIAGVQRLIGVVTYLAKFLPNLSTVCEPLRRLTDKEAVFDWLPHHEEAFVKVKDLITQAPVLSYYDVNKEVTIESDSSEVGLGAVITQDGHPIAYASRALTPTERNYAQIEKECLAIVYATQKFEQYILGMDKVTVLTDHKPLTTIFKKPILSSPKRLQRMRLRLQRYSIQLYYKPGPKMHISDTLSRASLPITEVTAETSDYTIYYAKQEAAVRQEIEDVDLSVFVSDERLQQIQAVTRKDATLQTLMNMTLAGWPEDKTHVPLCIREYWPYRDEISVQEGLVFRGTRVVIPMAMRNAMMKRAHASHMGVQYTINTARDIMYWPNMNNHLTQAVQACEICQEDQPAQAKEPLMTYPIPQHPWQVVASDCFEQGGKHYVIIADLYSDYIEVSEIQDLTSSALIHVLKPLFASYGVPMTFISDNGPNYSSQEFQSFSRTWEFKHITTSPHFHKANGKAEASVKIIKRMFKRCKKKGMDKWQALLEWRNTITPGENHSPAQKLLSRRTRSMLPAHGSQYKPSVVEKVRERVGEKRKVAKLYHDRSAKPLPQLVIGQPVRVKTHPQQPHSDWKPGQVTQVVAPRSYTVDVNGGSYRRNRIHLRDALETETGSRDESPPPAPNADAQSSAAVKPTIATPPPATVKPPETRAAPTTPGRDSSTPSDEPRVSRWGRVINTPARYKD